MHDLIVLSADKDIEQCVKALVHRHQALGISKVEPVFRTHPNHDSGCATAAADVLAPARSTHQRALVVFDHEGSGCERVARDTVEARVESDLKSAGWSQAAAVVIAPEFESWFWSTSPHVAAALRWDEKRLSSLRKWLIAEGHLSPRESKPARPKEALEAARKAARTPKSPSMFGEVASKVTLEACVDPAFHKLRRTLQAWFPARKR